MISSYIVAVTVLSMPAIANIGGPTGHPVAAQEPRGATQQVFGVSGVVDEVDRVGRMITKKSAGVAQSPIYVGPTCRSLNN